MRPMVSESEFLREHQRTYRTFLKVGTWAVVATLVVLGLLLLFRT